MKKLFVFAILVCSFISKAQDNGIKLNLGSTLVRGLPEIQYEHKIKDNIGFQMNVAYALPLTLNFTNQLESEEDFDESIGETSFTTSLEYRGVRITPEIRFYSAANGAPRGFYVAPFLRYYSYKITSGTFIRDVDSTNRVELQPLKGSASINGLALGASIGSQWFIGDHFAIDITWIGLGVKLAGNVNVDVTSKNDLDWSEYAQDLEDELRQSEFRAIREAEVTHDNNGVYTKFNNPIPIVLRSSISIGYYF